MDNNKTIRVAHLVDSLTTGGMEQMAVNFVNGLANQNISTYLFVTRTTGILESKIDKRVNLFILNRQKTIDLKALIKTINIINENKINILHAHGSSIFWATLLKIINRKLIIIWHDHCGNSELIDNRPYLLRKFVSPLWSYIFTVNDKLKDWAIAKVKFKPNKIMFLNNFAVYNKSNHNIEQLEKIEIHKNANIICVANLRPQKDHSNLLEAYEVVCNINKNTYLHLIGVSQDDEYGNSILMKIENHKYKNNIFYWGVQNNVFSWLRYMQVGVIASLSEGLPVALLEYGLAGLSIVATDVGQINSVLNDGKFGIVVPPSNAEKLASGILEAINSLNSADNKSILFKEHLEKYYSENGIINTVVDIYKQCLEKS